MIPDRLLMELPGLKEADYELLAEEAVGYAVNDAPRLTGSLERQLDAIWSDTSFGIRWDDDYVWYQEAGINPFTMKSLAGKTIPMWIDDPDGSVLEENPKAKQRNVEGRVQTLIFRRAANFGERKSDGKPKSWPGAPGRIQPSPRSGLNKGSRGGGRGEGGRIQPGNVGVRWRHPGLSKRGFIRNALEEACRNHDLPVGRVRDQYGSWR